MSSYKFRLTSPTLKPGMELSVEAHPDKIAVAKESLLKHAHDADMLTPEAVVEYFGKTSEMKLSDVMEDLSNEIKKVLFPHPDLTFQSELVDHGCQNESCSLEACIDRISRHARAYLGAPDCLETPSDERRFKGAMASIRNDAILVIKEVEERLYQDCPHELELLEEIKDLHAFKVSNDKAPASPWDMNANAMEQIRARTLEWLSNGQSALASLESWQALKDLRRDMLEILEIGFYAGIYIHLNQRV